MRGWLRRRGIASRDSLVNLRDPRVAWGRIAGGALQHLEGLVNAIYHQVTNTRVEGINSRIQWIKYTARGFRNRDRFRTAIYFHLGGLDMTPEVLKPVQLHTT